MSKLVVSKQEGQSASLWLADCNLIENEDLPLLLSRLNSSETARYHNFLRPERRRQFLLGRVLLRYAVASLLSLHIDEVNVVEHVGHIPQLSLSNKELVLPGFSISHSRQWVACAVSNNNLLGLDVEDINANRNVMEIAKLSFHEEEHKWLKKKAKKEQLNAFYEIWSKKEAFYKLLSVQNQENISASYWRQNCLNVPDYSWHSQHLEQANLYLSICSVQALSGINFHELKDFAITCQ